ncbi:tetratricopeptide repeat protein [Roseomonas genomospecies 6]|nr:tetratricopeptide repeat protein [Roseomonas genomospecies 6]
MTDLGAPDVAFRSRSFTALSEREVVLRRILAADPMVGEAWLRLGGLALNDGRFRLAARCFARLMLLEPGRASALHNLGEALRLAGRPAQAAIAVHRALRLRPDYPRALVALATLHQQAGGMRAARRTAARALVLDPALAAGWQCLGLMLQDLNRPDAVLRIIRRAAVLAPADATARAAYGLALAEVKETAAVAQLRRAVALAPGEARLCGNLATALMQAGDHDGALALTQRVRRLDPAAAEADAQDCLLCMMRGDFRRGMAHARRALALAPDRAGVLINGGLLFHALRDLGAAIAWTGRALRLDPKSPAARFNLSLALLTTGDFARGWPLYEARWAMWGSAYPTHAPAWDGGPLDGRSLLLVAEQGYGDTLHFVRYASLLARQGARVVVQVQPALKRLLSRTPGVAAAYGLDEAPPPCDLCAPMLSVPGLLGTRIDTIPAALPYLVPAEEDRRTWRDRLAGERRLKVGLVWAGEPRRDDFKANSVDRRRSLTLAAFAPLAGIPGVAFYSLQKGEAGAQAKAPPPGLEIVDWTGDLRDFADTAALVERLDLVISVDTSVCHLAGGLGRPVWVLSRFDACWRWLDHREDSPWYPTMRLFRQPEPGAWDPVVARVAAALAKWAAERAGEGRADPIPTILAAALADHRALRTAAAARGYRHVLALDPGHADAQHLLGLTALTGGRVAAAAALLGHAVRLESSRAAFLNSQGELHRTANRSGDAMDRFRRAAVIDPAYAEPLVNLAKLAGAAERYRLARRAVRLAPQLADAWWALGHAALDGGRSGEAVVAYRHALALNPARDEGLDHLARACALKGRLAEAEALLARALRLSPDAAQSWRSLGDIRLRRKDPKGAEGCLRRAVALQPDFPEALNNLGGALLGAQRFGEARLPYRRAVALRPGYPDPWNNHANALHEIGETASALAYFRRALALAPDHPVAYANLAEALRTQAASAEDYTTVERLCRRALALVPGHPPALNVLSVTGLDLRRLEEAEAGFRRILDLDPDNPSARFNLSLVLLKAGRLREGWEHYEARWTVGELPVPKAPGRLWTGEPLDGRTILLHAEQGHGDALHFMRYAPLVAQRGGRVRLAVHSALRRLAERMPGLLSVHNLHDPLPVTDLHCPLMSLPRAFNTGLDDIPAEMPYLTPDPADAERWRARLPANGRVDGRLDGRLKVGLVWSGDPRPHSPKANAVDRRRSLTLAALAPLAAVTDVAFISLQKGSPAAQAKEPPPGMELLDWMDEVGDFADTAALVAGLDLVITVDTSVAHLAGALGKPVWVLSRYNGCWRWLTGRDDSPWYPTLRLFHQPEPGAWAPAVERVAAALAALTARRSGSG